MNIDEIENAMNNVKPPKEKKILFVEWQDVQHSSTDNEDITSYVNNLSNKMIACKSTAIQSFQFVRLLNGSIWRYYLLVKYRSGSVYSYKLDYQPNKVASEFLNSTSKGRYLATKIKNSWSEEKIDSQPQVDVPF